MSNDPGQVLVGKQLTADVDVSCDVCIVGSGAGGAVLAEGLAASGLKVVMLEEGGFHTNREFDLQERHAYPMLYQERLMRGTADLSIAILQGRTVGGGTVVNWTTCFRTPDRILAHWEKVHGLTGLSSAELTPVFERLERALSIVEWDPAIANANNRVLWDGCQKLGWEAKPLKRNVRGCLNTGYCGLGCPVNAKQSMLVTYLPEAVARGMTIYADTRAERLEVEGDRVVAVHGRVLSGKTEKPTGTKVVVRPKVAVSAGGAINGPALLLRSGLNRNGRVGRRTWLHPVVAMTAVYDRDIDGWYGAPQSVGSHQFIDRGEGKVGYFLETPPIHPILASTAFPAFGTAHQQLLSKLKQTGTLISVHADGLLPGDEGGTVTLRKDGRIRVDYPISGAMAESFRHACGSMARLELAVGAKRVLSLHTRTVELTDESHLPLLEEAEYGALKHSIFSAHQLGGCVMGRDKATSVVDSTMRHHEIPNLFVVDGSALPTSLGVNPSETIYALGYRARKFVGEAV